MDQQIIEQPLLVDGAEMLSKALGQLELKRDDYFIVTEGGKYSGVVDSRVLRDFFSDPAKVKCGKVVVRPPTLSQDDSDETVVTKLLSTRNKVLAVLDKSDRVVGAVTRWKALHLVKNSSHIHDKKVSELMTSPAIGVPESTSIARARRFMKENGIFRLVVLGPKGQASGMVSAFDFATCAHGDAKDNLRQYYHYPTPRLRMDEEPITSIMASPIQSIEAGKPVFEAVELFQKNAISSLAVREGDRLVGVLTARDVFGACLVQETANIQFIGLTGEERVFKPSLEHIAAKYWDKVAARAGLQQDDQLVISVRTKNTGGNKREYEVKSRITVKGKVFATKPNDRPEHFKNWDLQAAMKESLDDLVKMVG